MAHQEFKPLYVEDDGATPTAGYLYGQFLGDGRVLVLSSCRSHANEPHETEGEARDCMTAWVVGNAREEHYQDDPATPHTCEECGGEIPDHKVMVFGLESDHQHFLCPEHRTNEILAALVGQIPDKLDDEQ